MIERVFFPVDIYVRKDKTSKPVPENDYLKNRPSRYDIDAATVSHRSLKLLHLHFDTAAVLWCLL